MNIFIILVILALSLNLSSSNAQAVGSAFSYQGELVDNGSPANGDYNFIVRLFPAETGGPGTAVSDEVYNDVPVVNGLFNLELDFGDMVYEDSSQYYLELEVSPSAGGTPVVLAPRTKLLAVPYATQAQFLAPNGASTGDRLEFDGNNWVPVTPPYTGSSPWDVNGSTLSTSGIVGVGTSSPSDRLHVNADAGQDALRVQVDGNTKLRVLGTGGVSIGVNNPGVTPDNGMYVSGDVKQSTNSNGMLKFMLRANCDATPSIVRQYNGTNVDGTATISRNADLTCDIDMPIDVGNYFISVTPRYINANSERYANCQPDTGVNTIMTCKMFSGAGNNTSGSFDILIY